MKISILAIVLLFSCTTINLAQSEEEAVRATIMDYIEGTANGDIPRIERAFTETAALYAANPDGSLKRIPIADYINFFKPNQPTGRVGKIISVDLENNAAMVKVEIRSGDWKFTDYMQLLKLEAGWKIINKSYTRVKAD